MEDVFPTKKGVDYSKLKTTAEGIYSVTHKDESAKILNIIKQTVKNVDEKSITDLTGGIGGDTIKFGLAFKKVHSIEKNPDNFRALANNVGVFGLESVIKLHHGDAVSLYKWKTDVLFIDPPWGGPDYKKHKVLNLEFGGNSLSAWIQEIVNRKNHPSYIFLKLPFNYNFASLAMLENVSAIKSYKIRNYYLIAISI